MKRKISVVLALLLSLALLCGCGAAEEWISDLGNAFQREERAAQTEDMPRFDEIPYERPDVDALAQRVEELEAALDAGKSLEDVTDILNECYADYYHFVTMYNLAYIRSCQDVTDAWCAGEYAWCDEQISLVGQIMEDMYYLCGLSDMAEDLEKNFFWEGFAEDYGDEGEAVYDDELIALFQEESVLMTHYRTLMANPVLESDGGEEEDLFGRLFQSADDFDTLMRFYERYNEEAASIFIELVKVRQEQAKKLGFENYEDMAYASVYERDYSPISVHGWFPCMRSWTGAGAWIPAV